MNKLYLQLQHWHSGYTAIVIANLLHEMHLRWYAFGVDHFLKHVDHVVELSMDITNDDHWFLHA